MITARVTWSAPAGGGGEHADRRDAGGRRTQHVWPEPASDRARSGQRVQLVRRDATLRPDDEQHLTIIRDRAGSERLGGVLVEYDGQRRAGCAIGERRGG